MAFARMARAGARDHGDVAIEQATGLLRHRLPTSR
jgi:hypothetical protein